MTPRTGSPGQVTVPHQVRFLRQPHPEYPHLTVWGIQIGGTDLRVLVAQATRELWARELDDDDDTPEEREAFLLRQHAPLYFADEARARAHFQGDAQPGLRHQGSGALFLLGCPCGIDACWPLLATVTRTEQTITWGAFHQPCRPEWGELPLGPYTFLRAPYEASLAAPHHHAADPLAASSRRTACGDTQ
ncbi:hypothetical protein [Streptomyces sp. NPDC000351]|uniref:hypothetical protein n=1 Tax=Streptomyces sp. NPDC000351 TaxID=3154250 RepID=UPI00332D5443